MTGLLALLLIFAQGCGGRHLAPGSASTLSVVPPAAPIAEFTQPSGESLAILVPDITAGRLRSKAVAATPVFGPEQLIQRAELLLTDPDSPFPPGTKLLALYELDGGQLVVDLSPEIRQLKGSAGEQWAVASLVDTLAIDRPRLQGVRILVDGQPADTLGHLDLTEPFAPVLSLLPEKGAKQP